MLTLSELIVEDIAGGNVEAASEKAVRLGGAKALEELGLSIAGKAAQVANHLKLDIKVLVREINDATEQSMASVPDRFQP